MDARKWFPRDRDYYELRYQALKLRWWPKGEERESGQIEDLNWEPVKGLGSGLRVHELRIDDEIGGHDNIRVFFMVSNRVLPDDPLPRIWLLMTMQKKSQKLTKRDLTVLRARARLVLKRYYTS